MGLIDKLKVMFTEEVEETPIKKEMIQVEIPSPKEVRPQVEEVKPAPLKEEKPAFPIFFDDEDFNTLEKPKEKPKEVLPKPLNIADNYKGKAIEIKEKRVFKPTPIISPVYGILDKNYSKEDITAKKREEVVEDNEPLTIDSIRNKAYGTLEDDLEHTLTKTVLEEDPEPIIIDDEEDSVFDGDIDMFDELKEDEPKHAAPIIDVDININEYNNFEMSDNKEEPEEEKIDTLEMETEDPAETFETEDSIETFENDEDFIENEESIEDGELLLNQESEENDEELNKKFEEDALNESDLFDLIDSMYDKGDE